MNGALVERIADAVMYEGYILYPYRPSVKNRQRWTFGGLYPVGYEDSERSGFVTECLVRGTPETRVEATVRFLHLADRIVGRGEGDSFRPVDSLRDGERVYQPWQEAEPREVIVNEQPPCRVAFSFPGRRWVEVIHDADGNVAGTLVREQRAIQGEAVLSAVAVDDGLFRISLEVTNLTPLEQERSTRDAALARSLVSAHAILRARDGEFVSLTDPPVECREAASQCRNTGVWPVLVGDDGDHDAVLASPIILPDYPQLAPESPGDLFDGTEIDEILTMRILTLTDEEKRQAAGLDERTAALLARTAGLAPEQLLRLHGTLREVR